MDLLAETMQYNHLYDLNVTPDGRLCAFTVQTASQSHMDSITNVWVSLDAQTSFALPHWRENLNFSHPRWSADKKRLAVVVKDKDMSQYESLAIYTDSLVRSKQISNIPGCIEDILWMPDGSSLLLLLAEFGSDSIVTAGSQRNSSTDKNNVSITTQVGSGRRMLCEVYLDSRKPKFFGPEFGTLWEIELLDEQTIIGIWSREVSESGWYDAKVVRIDRPSGKMVDLYAPEWQLSSIAKSPFGNRIAFSEGWASDRGTTSGEIKVIELASAKVSTINSFGVDVVKVQWRSDDSVWFAGWQKVSAVWGWVNLRGEVGELYLDDIIPLSVYFSSNSNNLILDASVWSISAPRDFKSSNVIVGASMQKSISWKKISKFGSQSYMKKTKFNTSLLNWESIDGLTILGLLVYGTENQGEALPLVIYVHGGPASLWNYNLRLEVLFLLNSGYAVLLPNPRGSVGQGQEFAQANLGDAGGKELSDILLGIEACAKAILIDESKVSVIGGSYGGYLAACAATQSNKVICAVVMYGHPNLFGARFGSNNSAFYDKLMKCAPTLESVNEYMTRSPLMKVTSATAPTLILHGTDDRCCPISQAEEFYWALSEKEVHTKLITYPNEGHGLHGPAAKADCWMQVLAWLDRFSKEMST